MVASLSAHLTNQLAAREAARSFLLALCFTEQIVSASQAHARAATVQATTLHDEPRASERREGARRHIMGTERGSNQLHGSHWPQLKRT